MKTPTNHEDNQLLRQAAQNQKAREVREQEIRNFVVHYLTLLRTGLKEDFQLNDGEIVRYVREQLP